MVKHISDRMIKNKLAILPQLIFEVTDACNLKCKYCGYGEFYSNHDERKNQFFSEEKAIRLLEYLKLFWQSNNNTSYSQQTYISLYGGEPLLNVPFIKKIISWIEQNPIPQKRFIFSMTTNAMLLDRYMDYLVQHDFRILISLDGNEKNHSYRVDHAGKNSFKKVFTNIKLLQQTYPDFFETNVNFNVVLHNRNSVAEIYEFIKKEFGKKPRIAELNTIGIQNEKKALFWETYHNKYESLHQAENYEDIEKEMFIDSSDNYDLGIFLHQYSGNVFRSYNDLLINEKDKKMLLTGTCFPFSKKMFVTVNGKILPCERIGHQYALGQVTDREVILDFEKIIERYNAWYSKLVSQCTRCFNTKACVQCIFNLDDLDGKPVCKNFMNKESFQRYVSVKFHHLEKYPHLYKKIMEEVIFQ